MSLCGYQIVKLLGSGIQASVFLVKEDLAIKKINVEHQDTDFIISELDILNRVNHPNVVSAKETVFSENKKTICLVMPAGNIQLNQYIDQKINFLRDAQKKELARLVTAGLDYLHKNFVLHLDLHAENIILYFNKNGTVTPKIADFGLSKNGLGPCLKTGFNLFLSPPEVLLTLLEGKEVLVGPEFDNWYLGNVIYYIWEGHYPFLRLSVERNIDEVPHYELLYMIWINFGLTPEQEERFQSLLDANPTYWDKVSKWDNFKVKKRTDLLNPDPKQRKFLLLATKREHYRRYKILILDDYNKENKQVLFDWLWGIIIIFKYPLNVYFETIEILQAIIKKFVIGVKDFKKIGSVALNLATSLMDIPINPEMLIRLSGNDFTLKKFLKLRWQVIQSFNRFNKGLFRPTLNMLNPELSNKETLKKYLDISDREAEIMLKEM